MIYVRLAGGLGNQLFQIAAGALIAAPGTRMLVLQSALGNYGVARDPDCLRLIDLPGLPLSSRWARLMAFASVKLRAGRWLPFCGINDPMFAATEAITASKRFAMVDGYFQRGWTNTRLEAALATLKIQAPTAAAASRLQMDECAVHIRGGDFLKLDAYNIATADFYASAFHQAITAGFRRFAILTDDAPYANVLKDQLCSMIPGYSMRLLEPTSDPILDFDTLRAASARVIGNSTFAWWAAVLDDKRSLTWSPTHFTTAEPRDFFLPWERPVGDRILVTRMAPSQKHAET